MQHVTPGCSYGTVVPQWVNRWERKKAHPTHTLCHLLLTSMNVGRGKMLFDYTFYTSHIVFRWYSMTGIVIQARQPSVTFSFIESKRLLDPVASQTLSTHLSLLANIIKHQWSLRFYNYHYSCLQMESFQIITSISLHNSHVLTYQLNHYSSCELSIKFEV